MRTHKDVILGSDARRKVQEGVNIVADAVRSTMGAKGRTVITSVGHATKDGVTVAKDIDVKDPFAQKGADLIKQASIKTNDTAGDGTTTVCVIAQALINGAIPMIDAGKDAQELRAEIIEAIPAVTEYVKKAAKPCETEEDLARVGAVSANDASIGVLVAKVVHEVGHEGHVELLQSGSGEDTYDVVSGMRIDKPLLGVVFANNAQKLDASYEDAQVAIFDHKVNNMEELAKFLDAALKNKKPIVVLAEDYDDAVINSLAMTRIQSKGTVPILPLRTPIIDHQEVLEDLAAYTGATIINAQQNYSTLSLDTLGAVSHINTNSERTVLRPVAEQAESITNRIGVIRKNMESLKDGVRKKQLLSRISRLQGKAAIIRVGGFTDKEYEERKDRFQDAVFACQGALDRGTVPGGGMITFQAAEQVSQDTEGAELLTHALKEPMRRIAKNAAQNPLEVLKKAKEGAGFNALTNEFGDLDAMGIVDPVKVTLTAIENALSVSLVAITTEAVIALIQTKDDE